MTTAEFHKLMQHRGRGLNGEPPSPVTMQRPAGASVRVDRCANKKPILSPAVLSAVVDIPLRTANPLNGSHHNWFKRAADAKRERKIVGMYLLAAGALPELPVNVRMIRLGRGCKPMDSDGLAASFKHVRDEIAAAYGVDDADERIAFLPCEQLVRQPEFGVKIIIERRRAE